MARRRQEPAPTGGSRVPVRLRRFVQAEWIEDGPGDWTARAAAAHVAHTNARVEWMAANGYDPAARYGSGTPGWWDFLQRCRDEEPQQNNGSEQP